MATTAELIDMTYERLGRNFAFWTRREVVLNGLNPAQNLLTLLDRSLFVFRRPVELVAGQAFINLQASVPRILLVRRVVIGRVPSEVVTSSNEEFRPLRQTSFESLRLRENWFAAPGLIQSWFPYGRHMVGLFRRPMADTTLTLVGQEMPRALDVNEPRLESQLPEMLHPVIADLAVPFLLIKEGMVETQRALQIFAERLGDEPFKPMAKALRELRQNSAANRTVERAADAAAV